MAHIFGELVHIFGEFVFFLAWKLVSRTSKQVSRNLGPLRQPGVYNDTNPRTLNFMHSRTAKRAAPPSTGVLEKRNDTCDPGRHLQECSRGPGRKVLPGLLFERFWGTWLRVPQRVLFECFLFYFLSPKSAKKHSKSTLWGTRTRCPKLLKKQSGEHFPAWAPGVLL